MRTIKIFFLILLLAIVSLLFFSFSSTAQVKTLNSQTMPTGIYDYNDTTVRVDGYLTGDHTFENATIAVHSEYAHVFDTTIKFVNCKFVGRQFSTAWIVKNDVDKYVYLQKAINISLDNNIPVLWVAMNYTYSQQLKVEKVFGANFIAVNLTIKGDGSLHNQRQTLNYTGTGIALGFQLAKGGGAEGIWIDGNYEPPVNNGANYYNNPWPVMDGHIGIAIDYDGTRNNSGSSDVIIRECNVRNFDIGYAVSPNPTTNNADVLLFDRIRVHDCRVGFRTNQPQEKGNVITYIESWGKIHTVFQNGVNSRGAGDYVIHGGNIAGEPVQLFDVVLAGYNNFKCLSMYAENLGRIGRVNAFTSGSKMPAEISVDARLVHPSIAGAQTIFTGGYARTQIRSSSIRYYGSTGLSINMNSNFSIYNCDFEFSTLNAPSAAVVDFEQDRIVLPRKVFVGKAFYLLRQAQEYFDPLYDIVQ